MKIFKYACLILIISLSWSADPIAMQRPNVCCLTILNTSKPPLPPDTLCERSSTWAGHKASSSFPNKVTCSLQVDTFRNLRFRILNNTWPFSKSVPQYTQHFMRVQALPYCVIDVCSQTLSYNILYLNIWNFYQTFPAVKAYPSKNSSAFMGRVWSYCNSGTRMTLSLCLNTHQTMKPRWD